MFTDTTKSVVKIADWGLAKVEDPLAVKDVDSSALLYLLLLRLPQQQISIGNH